MVIAKKKDTIEEPLEKQLWKAADKLRKNIDAAEYKHVVLGLIFLKYISVSFEELYAKLQTEVEMGADPEDREEYKYVNMIYRSISYSYEELTIIYNYTDIGDDIEIGHDPDYGKFYPKYLEKFGVQHDPKNNFEYRYSEN